MIQMGDAEWRPWPQDPRYLVGSDGTILSLSGQPLASGPINPVGHLGITIRIASGKRVGTSRHRIVCETFHGPCPPGMEVAHKNGRPEDCHAENLAWKTPLANTADKLTHGSPGAKLSPSQVQEIRDLQGVSQRRIARQYGISQPMVHYIKSERSWRDVESIGQDL